MKGYKAFDKDMKCRGFQYEVGKEYGEPEAEICEKGFHFCENPLDVLSYYDLCESTFAEVEATGKTVGHDGNSKHATTKIKIKAKLDLAGFVKASVDFLLQKTKTPKGSGYDAQLASSGDDAKLASSGYDAQLASSGYDAQLASSGDDAQLASSGYDAKLASSGDDAKLASSGDSAKLASSGDDAKLASSGDSAQLASAGDSAKLASSGDSAQLELNGEDSVGAAIGRGGRIKGKIGNWITLAEWKYDEGRYVPVCVKSARIDGKKLKEDTVYMLRDKKFTEVK